MEPWALLRGGEGPPRPPALSTERGGRLWGQLSHGRLSPHAGVQSCTCMFSLSHDRAPSLQLPGSCPGERKMVRERADNDNPRSLVAEPAWVWAGRSWPWVLLTSETRRHWLVATAPGGGLGASTRSSVQTWILRGKARGPTARTRLSPRGLCYLSLSLEHDPTVSVVFASTSLLN